MQSKRDELFKLQNFDLLASNMVSVNRTLPDRRSPECIQKIYPQFLPKASVIIIFHNEAWSTLIRTIWSIINRSPSELMKEIILVDDDSTDAELKEKLDDYIKSVPITVRIIRTGKREGLIRARLIGARNASGSVLIFLDAHIECTDGWIEPLLYRIAIDRSVVAVPVVERISSLDMKYEKRRTKINGFIWILIFNW